MFNQKSFSSIAIIIAVVVIFAVGVYFILTREQKPVTQRTTPPPATPAPATPATTEPPTLQQPSPTMITVKTRFTFPVGGERFALGKPLVINWELPTNIRVSDVTLQLNPIDPTKDINGYVHIEYPLSSQIRSYTWNGKFMYIPVGPTFVPMEVKPGRYYLRLGFRTADGHYQGIDSGQFELS